MGMEINDIGGIIQTVRSLVGLGREVFDALPAREKKKSVKDTIESAEHKLKEYNADLAVKLGYQICRSHFPPVVMLEDEKTRVLFRCPVCGKEIDTAPASASGDAPRRGRLMERPNRW